MVCPTLIISMTEYINLVLLLYFEKIVFFFSSFKNQFAVFSLQCYSFLSYDYYMAEYINLIFLVYFESVYIYIFQSLPFFLFPFFSLPSLFSTFKGKFRVFSLLCWSSRLSNYSSLLFILFF